MNGSWSRNVLKGRYHPARIARTGIVFLVLCAMIGSMISGIILSRHALAFLPIKGGRSWARNLHMVFAYWGFVLMSVHLGFHWSMIMGMAGKLVFFDYDEPRIFFYLDYIAVMGLFVFIGNYVCAGLRSIDRRH